MLERRKTARARLGYAGGCVGRAATGVAPLRGAAPLRSSVGAGRLRPGGVSARPVGVCGPGGPRRGARLVPLRGLLLRRGAPVRGRARVLVDGGLVGGCVPEGFGDLLGRLHRGDRGLPRASAGGRGQQRKEGARESPTQERGGPTRRAGAESWVRESRDGHGSSQARTSAGAALEPPANLGAADALRALPLRTASRAAPPPRAGPA